MAARSPPPSSSSTSSCSLKKNILALLLLTLTNTLVIVSAAELGCSNMKYVYTLKGIDPTAVPREPVSGERLQICQQGRSCCTEEMEQNFIDYSRQEFNRILNTTINQLQSTLAARALKFDEFFKELLKKSKRDFHEMFLKTYGMLYEQNSEVFTDLFNSLEKYYSTGQINLVDALEAFFTTLYQKMFTVLNAQYTFEQKYLNCVSEYMEELKPFGDVPWKLSVQIRRAFIAARVFVRGLVTGRDVVRNMLEVPFSPECNKALTKMSYCPHCQGLRDAKPCNNYCLNVMKGCLAYHAELDKEWNNYIDSLLMLADRLEGPFNIESVVDPIDIKISDAIMNFQESGTQVSQKVFQGCGQPRLGKRDVSHELNFDTYKFRKPDVGPRPTTAAGTSLDRLVKDIRSKVKSARAFWTQLSYKMCTNDLVSSPPSKLDDDCWNGLSKAKYDPPIVGDGLASQAQNPEVNLDVHHQNSITNEQIVSLRTVTDRLKNAFNGIDVVWVDSVESMGESGGGGSGGSGDGGSGYDDPPIEVEGDVPEKSGESDFAFTSTVSVPDIKRPDLTTTTTAKPPSTGTGAPTVQKMSLNRAFTIITVPILIAWFGSVF